MTLLIEKTPEEITQARKDKEKLEFEASEQERKKKELYHTKMIAEMSDDFIMQEASDRGLLPYCEEC
jgi:type IV secretory pathway component VirB8